MSVLGFNLLTQTSLLHLFFFPKLTRFSNQKICLNPASLVKMSFILISYGDVWSGKMNLGHINKSSLSISVYTCSMFSWHFLLSSSSPGYKRLHFAWTSVINGYHTVGREALWGYTDLFSLWQQQSRCLKGLHPGSESHWHSCLRNTGL